MIQYIREFALKNTLKNTVRVRVIFELFTYWNWGWGLELALVCKFVRFCRPLANDFKVVRTSVINWSRFSGHSRVRLWVDITLQTQCWN